MSKTITFIIRGQLPNLNDYTKACRTNRYAGAKMKQETEKYISWHIVEQLRGIHIDTAVRLSFRWYEQNRKRDLDNICFAKKFILDALVSSNVLQADGWSIVTGFTDTFFVDRNSPRVEVDIIY